MNFEGGDANLNKQDILSNAIFMQIFRALKFYFSRKVSSLGNVFLPIASLTSKLQLMPKSKEELTKFCHRLWQGTVTCILKQDWTVLLETGKQSD